MARSRSKRAHEQVLAGAIRLFSERGIEATSMDAIAELSKVSKATIYKHWPNKDALCLEVMGRVHGLDEPLPLLPTDEVQQDLIAVLGYRPPNQDSELQARLMPHFMAYAARNPAFGAAWRARVLEPKQQLVTQLLKRAIKEKIFPRKLNLDLALSLLIGPTVYSYFLNLADQPLHQEISQNVVETFWKAHALPRKSVSSRKTQKK